MDHLALHIESLIFVADQAITIREIKSCLEECFDTKIATKDIDAAIQQLITKYEAADHAMELVPISDGYQFLTKEIYHTTVGTYLKQQSKKKLSKSALETLSIIAYRQPVTKGDLEAIRGVGCDYAINKLLEKELVGISGRSEAPGRPLLYVTSSKFMDYFGLQSLKDLPKLRDIETTENEIGETETIEISFAENTITEEE